MGSFSASCTVAWYNLELWSIYNPGAQEWSAYVFLVSLISRARVEVKEKISRYICYCTKDEPERERILLCLVETEEEPFASFHGGTFIR